MSSRTSSPTTECLRNIGDNLKHIDRPPALYIVNFEAHLSDGCTYARSRDFARVLSTLDPHVVLTVPAIRSRYADVHSYLFGVCTRDIGWHSTSIHAPPRGFQPECVYVFNDQVLHN